MNKEEIMNKIQLYEFCENMEELYDDYYVPLQQENKQLKEKYNKTLKIFEKTEILPCECFEEYFDCTECDYCNNYCSNADIKCWDNFIENFDLKGDGNE